MVYGTEFIKQGTLVGTGLVVVSLLVAVCSVGLGARPPRIGDRGSVFDPSKFDPRFPLSREWAKAGVEGGIPPRKATPVAITLKPGLGGQAIQAAIDRVGSRSRRAVILLEPGLYKTDRPIRMKSGVILRGADREKTIIEYENKATSDVGEAVRFQGVQWAALEDLTLRHAKVFAKDPNSYVGQYKNFPDYPIGNYATIDIRKSSNCWVQNCNVLCSVSRPLRIFAGSKHITMRDNLVDKSLHKGGKGSGYYEVVNATYVLFYNETVKNVRHICLNGACDYTVMIHCDVSVDINWHCIPPMKNTLVESVRSRLHPNHPWPPLCHYRDAVGPDNLIYMLDASGPKGSSGTSPDPSHLYTLRTNWDEEPWVYRVDGPPPKHGTLYPVTGVHRPPVSGGGAAVGDEWDARLLARLGKELKAKRRPKFYWAAARRQVELLHADKDGALRVHNGVREIATSFSRLRTHDKKNLAVAVAKKDNPADCALAAYYLFAAGMKAEAEQYLKGADKKEADRLRAAFE